MIITDFSKAFPFSKPLGLCLGNFDGVHLGHQSLLAYLRSELGKEGTLAIVTFSNHPLEVLASEVDHQYICSLKHRVRLLKFFGVDVVYLIEFTKSLSRLSYDAFLKQVRQAFPFDYLVRGEGSTFGKNREGNQQNLEKLAKEWGFSAFYLPNKAEKDQIISSGHIRSLIRKNRLQEASHLLGRPFSLLGKLHRLENKKKAAFLCYQNLCLPTDGDYTVEVQHGNAALPARLKIHQKTTTLFFDQNPQELLPFYVEIVFLP